MRRVAVRLVRGHILVTACRCRLRRTGRERLLHDLALLLCVALDGHELVVLAARTSRGAAAHGSGGAVEAVSIDSRRYVVMLLLLPVCVR